MQDKENDPYFTTYLWFVKMTSDKKTPFYLTSFERELFGCIQALSRKRPCNATDPYFAKSFNVSIKHVNQSIRKLKERGLIAISHDTNKRTIITKISKGGCFYSRDNNYIHFMDLKGYLKIKTTDVGSLPNNYFDLPRG